MKASTLNSLGTIPANTTRLRVTVQASFVSGACAGDIFLTYCAIHLA